MSGNAKNCENFRNFGYIYIYTHTMMSLINMYPLGIH